ncbi:putative inactive poly [ADP-ribose] polymerase SRO3 [Tasmannia lanceolata]|uniref:putative inactive poly [ADP-ribose] polymerase SRO3 n=1 Tax=Tasmannia lanceolata TaxID=3420 RepID=UPI00406467E8
MKETIKDTLRSMTNDKSRNEMGLSLKKRRIATKIADRIRNLFSNKKLNHSSVFCSRQALIQNFSNFTKSSSPSRFMFFQNDAWNDFSEEIFGFLKAGFVAGMPVVEVSIKGLSYIFDFLRMLQTDLGTSHQRSIAWIDVKGGCFFPKVVVGEKIETVCEVPPCPKLEVEIKIDNNSIGMNIDSSDSSKERTDESLVNNLDKPKRYPLDTPCIPTADSERPNWPYVVRLKDGDKGYSFVKHIFLSGLRSSSQDVTVTSIRRISHVGPLGNARLDAFQTQIKMIKAARGRANVRLGWHGTSAKGVASIATHGFGQANRFSGSEAYGVGVYLSPQQSSHTSASLAEADDNGEKHVVLCRVIMGNTEEVEAGSQQFHPSSEEFDSGVDDIINPRWYILWSTHMNTHILPEYVVSFKSSEHLQERGLRRISPASNFSFPKLLSEMGKSLSSSTIHALQSLYTHYKAGKIRKDVLIKQFRLIAGDKVLVSTIQRIRGH